MTASPMCLSRASSRSQPQSCRRTLVAGPALTWKTRFSDLGLSIKGYKELGAALIPDCRGHRFPVDAVYLNALPPPCDRPAIGCGCHNTEGRPRQGPQIHHSRVARVHLGAPDAHRDRWAGRQSLTSHSPVRQSMCGDFTKLYFRAQVHIVSGRSALWNRSSPIQWPCW